MFMVSYYPMLWVKTNKGDKIPLHVLKNTTEAMTIYQTPMGHLYFPLYHQATPCLLYTSDAADEGLGVDLGGRRIIKKKKRGEGWREGVGGGARRQSGSERLFCFFFQAEDGIRDLVRSRGLGDVYKRQVLPYSNHRLAGT